MSNVVCYKYNVDDRICGYWSRSTGWCMYVVPGSLACRQRALERPSVPNVWYYNYIPVVIFKKPVYLCVCCNYFGRLCHHIFKWTQFILMFSFEEDTRYLQRKLLGPRTQCIRCTPSSNLCVLMIIQRYVEWVPICMHFLRLSTFWLRIQTLKLQPFQLELWMQHFFKSLCLVQYGRKYPN